MTDPPIRLEIGEPDFTTPQAIIEAGRTAMNVGKIGYTSTIGDQDLREAVADRYLREFGVVVNSDTEVMITAGGAPALYFALLATANPGDEILIPDPGYPNYAQLAKLIGCVPVMYPLRETLARGFELDLEAVRQRASAKTRVIIVNSPSNPTGGVISDGEALELGEMVEELGLAILSDEVYDSLVYDAYRHVCLQAHEKFAGRTVTVGSASKTYSMTGWRVGYVLGPGPIVAQMAKFHSLINTCANRIGQVAYREALHGVAVDACASMVAEFLRRRDFVVEALRAIPGIHCPSPRGAFYVFPNISELGMPDVEFCRGLLSRHKVTCVPGSGFGPSGAGHIRISYANSLENLVEAMRRIATFVEEIREGSV